MDAVMMRARMLLDALGCAIAEEDEVFLTFCAGRVREEICGCCNVPEIPEKLEEAAAGWTAALFLEGKKDMGQLEGMESFDYQAAVQQIQEGDTTVRYFEHPSPEQRLEGLIALLKPTREALAAHRRLKW